MDGAAAGAGGGKSLKRKKQVSWPNNNERKRRNADANAMVALNAALNDINLERGNNVGEVAYAKNTGGPIGEIQYFDASLNNRSTEPKVPYTPNMEYPPHPKRYVPISKHFKTKYEKVPNKPYLTQPVMRQTKTGQQKPIRSFDDYPPVAPEALNETELLKMYDGSLKLPYLIAQSSIRSAEAARKRAEEAAKPEQRGWARHRKTKKRRRSHRRR
jgi:hypothetical protein